MNTKVFIAHLLDFGKGIVELRGGQVAGSR